MDSLTTPLLYGALLDWALLGVLCTQFYVYVRWYFKHDRKSWVALAIASGLFLTEVVETALTTHTVQQVFLEDSARSFKERAIPVGLVVGGVQIYFAWWHWYYPLRRSTGAAVPYRSLLSFTLVAALVMLFLVQIATALMFGIMSYAEVELMTNAARVWAIAAILDDVAIAVSIGYSQWDLRIQGKRTAIFGRIVLIVIVTTLLCAGHLAVGACTQLSTLNVTFAFATGKLYSNILLADLNRRRNTGTSYVALDETRILSISTIPTMRIVANSEARMSTFPDWAPDERVASIEEGRVHTEELVARPDDEQSISDSASYGPPPTYRS